MQTIVSNTSDIAGELNTADPRRGLVRRFGPEKEIFISLRVCNLNSKPKGTKCLIKLTPRNGGFCTTAHRPFEELNSFFFFYRKLAFN